MGSRVFTGDPEVGVSRHSRRVLVKKNADGLIPKWPHWIKGVVLVKKNADGLIPKWLHWIKGVVDCEDMPEMRKLVNLLTSYVLQLCDVCSLMWQLCGKTCSNLFRIVD